MPKKRHAAHAVPMPEPDRQPSRVPQQPSAEPGETPGGTALPGGLVVPRRVAKRITARPAVRAAVAPVGAPEPEPVPTPIEAPAVEPEVAAVAAQPLEPAPVSEPEPEIELEPWIAAAPVAEPEPGPVPTPEPVADVAPERVPGRQPLFADWAESEWEAPAEPRPAPEPEPWRDSDEEHATAETEEQEPVSAFDIDYEVEHDLEPVFEPEMEYEPEPEPEAEPEPERKGGLLSRLWRGRAPAERPRAVPAPPIADAFEPEPISDELLASLEGPAPEGEVPAPPVPDLISEPVDEVLDEPLEEALVEAPSEAAPVEVHDASAAVTADTGLSTTAPFAFVGEPLPTQASAEPALLPEAPSEALADVVPGEDAGGRDHVTEFGVSTVGEAEEVRTAADSDWLASRDEPSTVPLAAWIAPEQEDQTVSPAPGSAPTSVEAPDRREPEIPPRDAPASAPLAPELPLPAAEERPDEDWWPEEPSTGTGMGELDVEDEWWVQSRMTGHPAGVPVAPPDGPLIGDAPRPPLAPEPDLQARPQHVPDLIPIADMPPALIPRDWELGEAGLELFEELETTERPAPPRRPGRGAPPPKPRKKREQPEPRAAKGQTEERADAEGQPAEPRKGKGRTPEPRKGKGPDGEPGAKGRSWWPFALTIGLILAGVFAAIAVGARVGTAVLWDAVLPGETAVSAPDEYSYVLPSWPVFGAAPAEAETAPPAASLVASEGSTVAVTPVDPVLEAALPYPDPPSVQPVVIRRLKPQHRYVAITLDDGIPFDTRLMDLFSRYDARATTFVLGQFASTRPELIDRLRERGFEIANHSWDHKDLSKMSDAEIRNELGKTQAAISAVTGNQAPYMRPPGGAYDDQVVDVSASMGYRVVMWNRSLADTSPSATPEQLYHNAVDNLQAGDIILCHWGRPDTYAAMTMILPELKRRGFRAVTLSELIADSGGVGALE